MPTSGTDECWRCSGGSALVVVVVVVMVVIGVGKFAPLPRCRHDTDGHLALPVVFEVHLAGMKVDIFGADRPRVLIVFVGHVVEKSALKFRFQKREADGADLIRASEIAVGEKNL